MPARPPLPVLAGSTALLLAALLALGLVPRWRAEADSSNQAWQALRPPRAGAGSTSAPAPAPAAGPTLVPALPLADTLPQRQAALAALAQRHGITLDGLRLSAAQALGSGGAALAAERVPLRLVGSAPYAAWRRFVAEALQQDDALLLEQLQLGRSSPSAAVLGAELQWSLLQRRAANATPSRVARP